MHEEAERLVILLFGEAPKGDNDTTDRSDGRI
jgi:hypothetical protein